MGILKYHGMMDAEVKGIALREPTREQVLVLRTVSRRHKHDARVKGRISSISVFTNRYRVVAKIHICNGQFKRSSHVTIEIPHYGSFPLRAAYIFELTLVPRSVALTL